MEEENKNLPATQGTKSLATIQAEKRAYIPLTARQKMSPDEIAAIEASAGMLVKDYPQGNLVVSIQSIVHDCFVIRGQKIKDEVYDETVKQFAIEVLNNFSHFTIEQIREAVRKGANGDYEDIDASENKNIVHVTCYSMCRWIFCWNDKVKKEAIAKRNKAVDEEEAQLSEEKKEEGRKQFRQDLIEEFKYWSENKVLKQSGLTSRAWHAYLYLWLKERGYGLPNSEAEQIKERADKMIKQEWVKSDVKKEYLARLEEQRKELAREMALPVVFQKMVKFNIKIEDIE